MGCRNSNTKNIESSPFAQGIQSLHKGTKSLRTGQSGPFTRASKYLHTGHPIPYHRTSHSVPYHRASHPPFKSLRTGHPIPSHRASNPFTQGIQSLRTGQFGPFTQGTKSLHTGHQVPYHPSGIASSLKYNYKISNQVPSHRASSPFAQGIQFLHTGIQSLRTGHSVGFKSLHQGIQWAPSPYIRAFKSRIHRAPHDKKGEQILIFY